MDDNLDSLNYPIGLTSQALPRTTVVGGFKNITNVPVSPMYRRITPRQVSTGMQRGEQTLSGTLMVLSTDGSQRILIGTGPNGEFGLFSCTVNGNDPANLSVVWKKIGPTDYIYDPTNSYKNIMQIGKLTDGTYGEAVAKVGKDLVTDVFN